ncbi:MAG: M20/M25/M40 family metallo-hydrolase, partial [Chloroflexota bacterium]
GLEAAAAVVAEPTELRAVTTSKGVLRWRIRTRGRSAHSSKPHLGVNAVSHMARLVLALEEENLRLAGVVHPLLGPATVNVGVIHGGVQVNFVPDECVIEIDRRLLPGERVQGVLNHYAGMLAGLKAREPAFEAVMEPPMLVDEALETPVAAWVVQVASQVLGELRLDPVPVGVPYGSDASKLSRQGVPSIIFGPGSIDRAHAAVEYVECDQVLQAEEFYRRFMLRFE